MLASLSAQIRRLPAWGQAIAWPFYGMFWILYQIILGFIQMIGWMLKEMFGRAKSKAKKTFAPLLWPVAAILALMALLAIMGPQGMQLLVQILGPILVIGIMLYGLRVMVSSVWPMGKKKKK